MERRLLPSLYTLQPPWGVAQSTPQSNPRRPRRHLVAAHATTVSPSSVVGAGRAAGMPRPPTQLGALALATDSVGQRAAIYRQIGSDCRCGRTRLVNALGPAQAGPGPEQPQYSTSHTRSCTVYSNRNFAKKAQPTGSEIRGHIVASLGGSLDINHFHGTLHVRCSSVKAPTARSV